MRPSCMGAAALSVAPCPSVRPPRASDFLEIRKPQKLLIQWKHRAIDVKRFYVLLFLSFYVF